LRLPLLVFGGPYSNVRAVKALRARAVALGIGPDQCICTGDVVAYCAEPEETAIAIREWGCGVVSGNCEEQLAAGAADCGCGFKEGSECERLAKGWYAFAAERISAETRRWMASLPTTLVFGAGGLSVQVVHGGMTQNNKFLFASDHVAIAAELAAAVADVVIAGHAGLPFIAQQGRRVWFNPGVVGMPGNDGTPDVWFGLIERAGDELLFSTQRLSYDHHGAAAAMRKCGHADGYAGCLISGLWPSLDILPVHEKAATGRRMRERSVRIRHLAESVLAT
jgi:predicted phosphodiesterase